MFGVNSDFDNTAAYVQSWLSALKDNPEMVMSASSEAQKVVDYLLGMDLGDWSPIDGYTTTVKSKSDGEKDD
jgi:antirestriction protein ArdC